MSAIRSSFATHGGDVAYCIERQAGVGWRFGRYKQPMPRIVIGHEAEPDEIDWHARWYQSAREAELAATAYQAGFSYGALVSMGKQSGVISAMLQALKSQRFMLYAWRGARKRQALEPHSELVDAIRQTETAIQLGEGAQP